MNIVSNCPLCDARGLHVMEDSVQQCLNCGYVTSDKFIGIKEQNASYNELPEEMKVWSKEVNGRIWIPSLITLPFGSLYPIDVKGEMKWAFAEMIDIPEEDREKYPNGQGGFYEKMYDTDNQKVYTLFLNAMAEMNQRAKANVKDESTQVKLPKLKKVGDGEAKK